MKYNHLCDTIKYISKTANVLNNKNKSNENTYQY